MKNYFLNGKYGITRYKKFSFANTSFENRAEKSAIQIAGKGVIIDMKATGIVRKIDDLGRVVIPKEIRRTMRIREGDPLEIFTGNNGEVIFKKYSMIGELAIFASGYCEVLEKLSGGQVAISDRDQIISASTPIKKDFLDKKVSPQLEEVMESRKPHLNSQSESLPIVADSNRNADIVVPIVMSGDVLGSIVLFLKEKESEQSVQTNLKLATAAALFITKQLME